MGMGGGGGLRLRNQVARTCCQKTCNKGERAPQWCVNENRGTFNAPEDNDAWTPRLFRHQADKAYRGWYRCVLRRQGLNGQFASRGTQGHLHRKLRSSHREQQHLVAPSGIVSGAQRHRALPLSAGHDQAGSDGVGRRFQVPHKVNQADGNWEACRRGLQPERDSRANQPAIGYRHADGAQQRGRDNRPRRPKLRNKLPTARGGDGGRQHVSVAGTNCHIGELAFKLKRPGRTLPNDQLAVGAVLDRACQGDEGNRDASQADMKQSIRDDDADLNSSVTCVNTDRRASKTVVRGADATATGDRQNKGATTRCRKRLCARAAQCASGGVKGIQEGQTCLGAIASKYARPHHKGPASREG